MNHSYSLIPEISNIIIVLYSTTLIIGRCIQKRIMLHCVALREFVYIQKKDEISWENQIGHVLIVECIPQGRVVLNDIFKIFMAEMLFTYLL
jgi:hypothetical protein